MIFKRAYLILVFTLSFVLGVAQSNTQKVKETFNAKNYQLTIDEISSISASEIHFDSILYLKAYSQIKLNHPKDANITIAQILQISPGYYECHFLKGLLFALKENYPDAIAHFNKVLDANPNHEKALYNIALSKGLMEDYTGAIKDLDKCLQINPNYALAFYNRGYWYELLENYDNAIKDYSQALSLDPNYKDAYFALAYAYAQNGDFVNACETLHKAQKEGMEAANDLTQTFCK